MNFKYEKLGNLTKIVTGKLDVNAGDPDGKYPFFTCAEKPHKINQYAFDNEAVIVAGNGDLNVKYYKGKFNAYQRTYVIEITDENRINGRFLYYFLNGYLYSLRKQAIGGIIKYIKLNYLTDAKIPLPPLEEQIQIATVLSKAENLIAKRKQGIELLDEFVKSTYIEMFIDKGFALEKLGSLSNKITDGEHKKPDYKENGIPFISVTNITKGFLDFNDCKYVSEEDYNKFIKRCNPEEGDILYTKVGATYGRAAIVNTNEKFCLYVSVALIKPKKSIVTPKFLKYSLDHPFIKRQADKSIKGAGVPDLHLVEIKSFDIPVPPLSLQNQFAEIVNKVEVLKVKYQKSLEELENLYASLSQRAFRGEL